MALSRNILLSICEHPFAIRLYAGEVVLQKVSTPSGKTFHLLNLPYFLAEHLGEYAEWLVGQKLE